MDSDAESGEEWRPNKRGRSSAQQARKSKKVSTNTNHKMSTGAEEVNDMEAQSLGQRARKRPTALYEPDARSPSPKRQKKATAASGVCVRARVCYACVFECARVCVCACVMRACVIRVRACVLCVCARACARSNIPNLILAAILRLSLPIHAYTPTHPHAHRHTRTHTHAHAHAHAHRHTRTRTHAHAHAHTRTRTHTHTGAHAHTHTRTPIHPHVHVHARTHTNTNPLLQYPRSQSCRERQNHSCGHHLQRRWEADKETRGQGVSRGSNVFPCPCIKSCSIICPHVYIVVSSS